MKELLLTLLIGIIAGIIDILPMLKMKIDKYSTISAFLFYLIIPFFIININMFQNIWYIKGGIIAILMALPTIIVVMKEDKKSAVPMFIMSMILGSMIGIASHYLGLM